MKLSYTTQVTCADISELASYDELGELRAFSCGSASSGNEAIRSIQLALALAVHAPAQF